MDKLNGSLNARENKNKKNHANGLIQDKETKGRESNGSLFEIRSSEYMGRYLVATTDIKPGQTIIEEYPLIVGPVHDSPFVCIGCYAKIDIKNCSRCIKCEWPLCGERCPGVYSDLGHSKAECQALLRLSDKPNGVTGPSVYNVIVPLRCLLAMSNDAQISEALTKMEHHNILRKNQPGLWETNQLEVVRRLQSMDSNNFSEDEIHTVCGYLDVNSFAIEKRGIRGLYPTAYLMSHDCIPNTGHCYGENHQMRIWAIRHIKKGDSITISYTNTIQGTQARRTHLKATKFFSCNCQRCADPTELGTFCSALKCDCQKGYILPSNPLEEDSSWLCSSKNCKSTRSDACVATILNRAMHEFDNTSKDSIQELDGFLEKYKGVFHPNHYLFTMAKHSLSQLYGKMPGYMITDMSDKNLQRKVEMCEDILRVCSIIDPGYSRLRGVTLYELHAPLMVLSQKKFESRTISQNELKLKLKKVVKLLKEATFILSFEDPHTPEGIIAQAAKDALESTKSWEAVLGKLS